jgi:predicted SPOUT superfamily RNA methylase MTH1
VNTVSRMEGQNKELGTALLISRATLAAVEGRVEVRERGAVRVKGKAQPVELFELVDKAEPGDAYHGKMPRCLHVGPVRNAGRGSDPARQVAEKRAVPAWSGLWHP